MLFVCGDSGKWDDEFRRVVLAMEILGGPGVFYLCCGKRCFDTFTCLNAISKFLHQEREG